MKIGIIGTGRVARSIGGGWAAAGHDVSYGSRTPQAVVGLDGVVEMAAALTGADVVVCAIPGRVALETLRTLGAEGLDGKLLIDVGNALDDRFELMYPNASLGAAIQRAFPGTAVVKTLNTVTAPLMSNPGAVGPSSVFVSGDDAAAKALVVGLLRDLGWGAEAVIDLGGIETARGPEHYIFLSMAVMKVLGTTSYALAIEHVTQQGSGRPPV